MLDNIRYVHFNAMFRKWNGFTIAYSRSADNIAFAVALVKYTDQYDKAVGRLVSTQRLETVVPDIDTAVDYFDVDNLVGNITAPVVLDMATDVFQIDSMFADQTVQKFNMFDFKHAFLSNVLADFVIENIK